MSMSRRAATEAVIRRRAFPLVVGNLGPAPIVVLPFTLVTIALMHNDMPSVRLKWWLVSGTITTTVTLVTVFRWYRSSKQVRENRLEFLLARMSYVLLGVHFGMSPWVVGGQKADLVMMFAMFPAVAGVVGCVMTAGRPDVFRSFLIPLGFVNTATLVVQHDTHLKVIGILAIGMNAGLVLFHDSLSRNTLDAIRLHIHSEQLVEELAHERRELTAVNDKLGASNRRLAHQATHDPLTGLYNRRGTLDLLEHHFARVSDTRPLAMLYLDLDRFKAVNDALGHRGGDKFINEIATRIADTVPPGAIAGRMGGDEFVVVLPKHDADRANQVATQIVEAVARPVVAEGREVPSSCSIGLAVAPRYGTTATELMRNANNALYKAKNAGRDRVEAFDDEMYGEVQFRIRTEQALRKALESGEIVPFFQPEVDAVTGTIIGAELFARWVTGGKVVTAHEFIEAARSAQLLHRVTEQVINGAKPHIQRLAEAGLPRGFRFRVNVSPDTVGSRGITWADDPIAQLLGGIDPRLLIVDVHESSMIDDEAGAAHSLERFRAAGGRVCLDDFARGVSGLSLLRRLPLDEVRIDRLSLDSITSHPHDRAIVRAVIGLVRDIGLMVTADGVETSPQADALVALGCIRHQGHLYAAPMPLTEFLQHLDTSGRVHHFDTSPKNNESVNR